MTKPSYRKILVRNLITAFIIFVLSVSSLAVYIQQTYNRYISSAVQNAGYEIANSIKDAKYSNGCEALHRLLLQQSKAESLSVMEDPYCDVLVGVIKITDDNIIHHYICTDEGFFIELKKGSYERVLGNSDSSELRQLYNEAEASDKAVFFTKILADDNDVFYPYKAITGLYASDEDGNTVFRESIEHDFNTTVPKGLLINSISSPSENKPILKQVKPMEYLPSPNIKLTYGLLYKVRSGEDIASGSYSYISTIEKYNGQFDIALEGIKRSPVEIIVLLKPSIRFGIYITLPVLALILIFIAILLAHKRYSKLESDYLVYESQIQMTRSMAHDLKTPLAALAGYAENIASESDETKRNYYARKIEDNAHSMAELVSSILQFSKTANEYKLTKESINIKNLITDCFARLEPQCKDKELKIDVKGDAAITTDKLLFEQSINNLTDNAVKYSKEKTTVTIEIAGNSLTVTNTPSSPLKKKPDELLKPFVRDDDSRNITKGTGLGLAIVQRNLSLLGMKIKLKTDKDLFTVIVLY